MYSQTYKRYVTILLLVVYIFNRADAGIFGFLMEPIKQEFRLSDSQLGFLAGPALVLLYAALGIPVARLADRSSRVNIISIAVTLWSCIVTLSAAVSNFWQFALARVGVGVGEAGFSAVAQSLITDYHSPRERAKAISIFMLALPLGNVVSSLLAGWINQEYGWRAVFVAAGLPGIALALLVKTTVREPSRRVSTSQDAASGDQPPLRLVFTTLWKNHSLRHLAIAMMLANTVCSCILTWMPTFFIRSHGMSTGELGTWFAVILGVGGSAGVWLSGYLCNRPAFHSERSQARLMAYVTMLVAPVAVAVLWSPLKELALLLLLPAYMLMFFFYSPTFALVQGACAAGMRATMAAFFILIQVLAGGALGVQILGLLSDAMAEVGADSASALKWSLTVISSLALWASAHFWLAGREIADLKPRLT